MGKFKIKKEKGTTLGKILLRNRTNKITRYIEPGFMVSFFEGKEIYALIDDFSKSQVAMLAVNKEYVQGIRDRMRLVEFVEGDEKCSTYIKKLTKIVV